MSHHFEVFDPTLSPIAATGVGGIVTGLAFIAEINGNTPAAWTTFALTIGGVLVTCLRTWQDGRKKELEFKLAEYDRRHNEDVQAIARSQQDLRNFLMGRVDTQTQRVDRLSGEFHEAQKASSDTIVVVNPPKQDGQQ